MILQSIPEELHLFCLFQTEITFTPLALNPARASGAIPESVTKISISVTGQISAGLTMAILLESATMITCLAWRTMARKTARFIRLDDRRAVLHIYAAGADDSLVKEHAAERFHRRRAGKRERARPPHRSSGQGHVQGGLSVQFHADIHCVGDHVNAAAMADASSDLSCCGSSCQADGFMLRGSIPRPPTAMRRFSSANRPSRTWKEESKRNGSYCVCPASFDAAMSSMHQATLLKPCQVAANAGRLKRPKLLG